ncbi:iron chelate uptake ABC transporter family permease subunit [Nocardioides humilatus]|uniref:Iron chelate uptake ABC transporter family permease subunit n=1 Tax=Nocardioides humilatus TaxID=2607660 RepID=A0A5B1LR05_9ACTN|nr:iron chelate uptake ABC transporter family permease subunit [Nocardioides humilatus]
MEPTADPVAAVRRARRGPRRRYLAVLGGLIVLATAAFAVNVLLGDYTYTVPDFFRILFGEQLPVATYLLMESKLPRAVLGILVGLCFGIGGAVFQTTLRNPLASPDVVGVTWGASTAAVVAVITFGLRGTAVSLAAIGGAVAVALLIRSVGGNVGSHRIVLVGVAMTAALASFIEYLLSRASIWDVQVALQWLAGSLHASDWPTVRAVALSAAILLPLLAVLSRSLRVTQLGDDLATGLGARRFAPDGMLLIAVLLVAVAVAASGPIAFVAFMAGPTARALNGGRPTLLGAGLVGVVLVLSADFVGHYLIGDITVPVGVLTGACGAPFMLWLLARGTSSRSSS